MPWCDQEGSFRLCGKRIWEALNSGADPLTYRLWSIMQVTDVYSDRHKIVSSTCCKSASMLLIMAKITFLMWDHSAANGFAPISAATVAIRWPHSQKRIRATQELL